MRAQRGGHGRSTAPATRSGAENCVCRSRSWFHSPGPSDTLCAAKIEGQCGINKMISSALLDASADYGHKQSQHGAKATHLYDFVRHHSGLANKLARVVLLLTISSSSSEH